MVHYIKNMIAELVDRLGSSKLDEGIPSRFSVLAEELDRLDPREFQPAERFSFVDLRRRVRNYAKLGQHDWDHIVQNLDPRTESGTISPMRDYARQLELSDELWLWEDEDDENPALWTVARGIVENAKTTLGQLSAKLDSYVGSGAVSRSRQFAFMQNAALRVIAERDYRELTLKLFPTESWKSVVILAGSVLEALLFDLLTRNPTRIAAAMASPRAPQRSRAHPPAGTKNIQSNASEDQWMLNDLIEVSDQLGLLPAGWRASIQAVLRDFRNYVHPRKELSSANSITEGEAFQSVGALMRICEHIQANHP